MQMVCPDCGLSKSYPVLPLKLQVCPSCARQGSDHYLTVTPMELRVPVPRDGTLGGAIHANRALRRKRNPWASRNGSAGTGVEAAS